MKAAPQSFEHPAWWLPVLSHNSRQCPCWCLAAALPKCRRETHMKHMRGFCRRLLHQLPRRTSRACSSAAPLLRCQPCHCRNYNHSQSNQHVIKPTHTAVSAGAYIAGEARAAGLDAPRVGGAAAAAMNAPSHPSNGVLAAQLWRGARSPEGFLSEVFCTRESYTPASFWPLGMDRFA